MQIGQDTVVSLHVQLADVHGNLIQQSAESVQYLHGGYDGIFPKVEEALEGRDVGHELALTLEPEDAFGDYDAELLRVEPRASFPESLEVGMRFEGVPGDDEDEALIYTVTDVTAESVVVDGNHPLAGERLWFKAKVSGVRPATADELQHGHPHGDLGAHAA